MIYCRSAFLFIALMIATGVSAQVNPDNHDNGSAHQAASNLTGYWQTGDGEIFYFTQQGSSLTSRHWKPSDVSSENDTNFTATVHGNLIYGAHRAPSSRVMQAKCSRQIWVGMGLTLNDDGNELKGFRGDRMVDPNNCSANNSDPVGLVYTRIKDFDPLK